jgi:amidase
LGWLPDRDRSGRLRANAPTPASPPGFDARPAPYGVSFTGLASAEPRLVGLAFAFEQATKRRVPPKL